jgi:REP element-mobilizing transposase RayT
MSDPLAYFLTWTTYGSWLPGDDRGWVDDSLRQPAPALSRTAKASLKQAPVVFTPQQRNVVEQTIRQVCAYNGWRLWAVNCRSNHVHAVVSAADQSPERVMNSLKSWCSRRLNEQSNKAAGRANWWTRHGSTRYLNDEESLDASVEYTLNGQEGSRFE